MDNVLAICPKHHRPMGIEKESFTEDKELIIHFKCRAFLCPREVKVLTGQKKVDE